MNSTSSAVPAGKPADSYLTPGSVGQLIAGLGALVALLSPIWLPLAAAGVAVMLLGVIVSAPSARCRGPYLHEWWTVLAAASLACLVGFGLGLVIPVAGGVLLTTGGVVALVAVGLGTPPHPEEDAGGRPVQGDDDAGRPA